MESFTLFFLIVFSGVFFSMLSIRTHIPWAVMLIIGGVVFGPSVLGILSIDPTIVFYWSDWVGVLNVHGWSRD